jgi:hypothetical protein
MDTSSSEGLQHVRCRTSAFIFINTRSLAMLFRETRVRLWDQRAAPEANPWLRIRKIASLALASFRSQVLSQGRG